MDDDLAGDVHLPSAGAAVAAAVVVHPHPAMGGDRHHPLVVAVAERLATAGVAALRVDLRDPSVEASAARLGSTAADFAAEVGAERLVLVGYSWGALVTAFAHPAGIVGRVLVAPPVTMADLSAAAADRPLLVLVPEHDRYGPPDAVTAAFAARPDVAVETIPGADHFLAGAVARITTRATDWIDDLLTPD